MSLEQGPLQKEFQASFFRGYVGFGGDIAWICLSWFLVPFAVAHRQIWHPDVCMELVHTILQFSTESHFCLLDSELRGSKFLWLKGGMFLIVDFLLPQKLTANAPLKVRRMEVDIDGFQKRSKSGPNFSGAPAICETSGV